MRLLESIVMGIIGACAIAGCATEKPVQYRYLPNPVIRNQQANPNPDADEPKTPQDKPPKIDEKAAQKPTVNQIAQANVPFSGHVLRKHRNIDLIHIISIPLSKKIQYLNNILPYLRLKRTSLFHKLC